MSAAVPARGAPSPRLARLWFFKLPLSALVQRFGLAEKAFIQIQTRVDSLALPSGQFAQQLNVSGINITVRGRVIDGLAKIGTIFKSP